MQKNETGPHITPYTRVNCQYIEVLNVRPETIKLPDERIGVTSSTSLLALVFSFFFFDLTSKVMVKKAKINTRYYIKLKSFCTVNEKPSTK